MILQKKKKPDFIELVTRRSTVLPIAEKKQGLDFLVSFFSAIRPSSAKERAMPGKICNCSSANFTSILFLNKPPTRYTFPIGQY